MLALTLSKLEIAEILVNHGADINYVDIDGNNALMLMSDSGNYDALQLLIKHEPDVDKINSHGWTALMLAAQRGHAEIARLLLTMSANIHQRSVEGFSALMLASLNAHSNVTDILLSFDANANEKTMNDWTPLMLTSQLPNTLPCMKLLIEKGKADVTYINKYGWGALNIASFYGHDTIVEYLCLNGALHPVQNNQISALMLASFKGFPDVVKLLISYGSDVNQSNDAGITALMIAARFAKSDTVELLFQLEASVNSLDTFHRTPLLHACSQGNWEVIDVLLKYGSDYTVVDKRGLNCLMCACEKGHLLVVKELVEKHKCDTNLNSEIDVNTLDLLSYCHSFPEKSNLITPSIITVNALTISAFCGHKECAGYLLKFRHNSGTIDKSVLQVASKIGCHDLTAFEEKNNLAVLPSVSTKELSTLMQSCVSTDFVDKDMEFDSKTRTSSTNKPVLSTEKSPLELLVKMMSCIPPGFVPNLVLNILAPSGDIYIPQSTQCNVYAKNITNLAVDSVINSASSINTPLLRQESSSSTSLCI
ncbi:hypothetical protein Btru_019440 [Bulinus truncatus]|nr:hypothetical protein Btru_019440 [Bulinus truncatus]